MIRLFIVDDEPAALDNLSMLLEQFDSEVEIVGSASNVLDAVKALETIKIDALFLDISLPDGSGFDILEALGSIDFKVVFFTAYEEYAIKAIKQNAFDYLLKPVLSSDLLKTISKLKNEKVKESASYYRKIAVSTSTGLELIEEADIDYCKADNNYAHIFLRNGEEIIVSKPLKALEKALDEAKFIRPHQSYILNLNSIRKYVRSDSVILLNNNKAIPVSKSNRESVIRFLSSRGV